jgi:MoaD family protein
VVVTLKFIGAFRNASNKEKLAIKIEGKLSLREVIEKAVAKLPNLRQMLIDPELEDPRPNAIILVNGKEIHVLKGLDTLLRNGDEVVLIPVVHGG